VRNLKHVASKNDRILKTGTNGSAKPKRRPSVHCQRSGRLFDRYDGLNYCLRKDPDWWRTGRERLANTPEGTPGFVDPAVPAIRAAFDCARAQRFDTARKEMQSAIDGASERRVKGYLKQQMAEYTYHLDAKQSQELQLSAYQDNRRILRPIAGITYTKLAASGTEQAEAAAQFMSRFLDGNDLIVFANALVEDLEWYEDDASRFESAIRELGALLGFGSQRPEAEIGKGPDNLWAMGGLRFLIIEAKNGATTPAISKHDCNQLLGSVEWFKHAYDKSCTPIPVIIHPSNTFDRHASPGADFRVMDKERLTRLKGKLKEYTSAIATSGKINDPAFIRDRLKAFGFASADFVDLFTRKPFRDR
jgi:hypothetical protein